MPTWSNTSNVSLVQEVDDVYVEQHKRRVIISRRRTMPTWSNTSADAWTEVICHESELLERMDGSKLCTRAKKRF